MVVWETWSRNMTCEGENIPVWKERLISAERNLNILGRVQCRFV